jgi:DNA mismatch repair protein MutS
VPQEASTPDEITPLMRQYLDVKERHPDCIVFFRLGDFYEMFYDDAVVVARTLDLTLTSRDKGKENPVPMCGVPHHASRQYLQKLVEHGFKVAICEQVEDPKVARGIVRREVVRIVTPGIVLDEEALDPKAPHYVASAIGVGARVGVAHLDVTTGEFAATEIELDALVDELGRIEPREILHHGIEMGTVQRRLLSSYVALPEVAAEAEAQALIEEVLGADKRAAGLGTLGLLAAAEVVRYARSTQPTGALPVFSLRAYRPAEQLLLDDSTRRNLELFFTLHDGQKRGSLLGVLDETVTAMGGRLLRRFLAQPLVDVAQIRRRHDAVEWLVTHANLRGELRRLLREVYDLERLTGRVTLGVASPRDLVALRRSLEKLPELAARLTAERQGSEAKMAFPLLLEFGEDLCGDVAADIARTLIDEPPAQWKEGGFCRRGLYPELDELLDLAEGGKERLVEIEARERERTGISSLKVRYNRVFGYYLEVTRSNLDRVPSDYIRKQTLANAERFVTAELSDYESKILHAEERRLALELETFERLRQRVMENASRLVPLGGLLARLDVFSAFAAVAHSSDYVRPEVDDSSTIEITEGRHPVVERLAADGKFVPNDVSLHPDSTRVMIITGPNMAGKSTVMRQVALISLLAQAGSFVPARRARLGVVDRIFTRVGASDNLWRGESTFMVEMRETAHILAHATRRSLVVLDEIGRGTSTYDGLSIAWAVAEHLHDRVGCKTMFATHYHELVRLAETRQWVRNFSIAVREWKEEVVFLHRLVEGGASRSYGIQVARLAGIDQTVIRRAKEILTTLEHGIEVGSRDLPKSDQLSLLEPSPSVERARPSEVEEALGALDVDSLSPREALAVLADLQAKLR